jgi:DNA-binding IclR family transcriptional regulator
LDRRARSRLGKSSETLGAPRSQPAQARLHIPDTLRQVRHFRAQLAGARARRYQRNDGQSDERDEKQDNKQDKIIHKRSWREL